MHTHTTSVLATLPGQAILRLFLLFMLSTAPAIAASPSDTPSIMNKLSGPGEIEKALTTSGKARILVRLNLPAAAIASAGGASKLEQRLSNIRQVQQNVLARMAAKNLTVKAQAGASEELPARLFKYSPLIAMEVDEATLNGLAADPDVMGIRLDQEASASLQNSVPLIGMTGAGGAYELGATGTGQAVAVIDTGVQTSHPFLSPRVIQEACFSSEDSSYISLCPNRQSLQTGPGAADVLIPACNNTNQTNICLHGTHVAGIAVGLNPDQGIPPSGVAKQASLVAVQVFHKPTGCESMGCLTARISDIFAGLEWVYQKAIEGGAAVPIAAVNISISYDFSTTPCDDDPMKDIIDLLRQQGITTVAASGNNGARNGLSAPACISSVVAVGSTTLNDTVSSFSNQSPYVDLLAPGSSILSSVPVSAYATLSGTSMATPHVAGAIAALRSAKPTATSERIESALKITGIPVTGAFTKPRIQVNAALQALDKANWLTLQAQSTGHGIISSSPNGILCGDQCLAEFPEGTQVELTATADENNRFVQWTGACQGTTPTCVLALNTQLSVAAEFKVTPSLRVISVPANGRIVSDPAGIDCQPTCLTNFDIGTEVTITAIPDTGYGFDKWLGSCMDEPTSQCRLVMDNNRGVAASFYKTQTLTVTNTGGGTIISTPTGIECPSHCQGDFRQGTSVSLQAQPDLGWEFQGWSGDCEGSTTCTVNMDQDHTVTAQFKQLPTFLLKIPRNTRGIVTSAPAGIRCGYQATECTGFFSQVILTAQAATGFEFTGWKNCPAVAADQTCRANLDQSLTLQALYKKVPRKPLKITKTRGGVITSEPVGLNCKANARQCSINASAGQSIRLIASPQPGYRFKSWGKACESQEGPICEVLMNTHQSVSAYFE